MSTLTGTNATDAITGTTLDDTITVLAGNDAVNGGNGDDLIYGGLGNDHLFGGNGDDTIYGGNGNDTIGGGHGSDELYGGFGNDTFVLVHLEKANNEEVSLRTFTPDHRTGTTDHDTIDLPQGSFTWDQLDFDHNGRLDSADQKVFTDPDGTLHIDYNPGLSAEGFDDSFVVVHGAGGFLTHNDLEWS
jgi:Ca2+-binding RTX toxin-like protein